MLVVGLTGNIGCGKSSLSNIFRTNNIKVIDADIISRQIYEDKVFLNDVYKEFGDQIKKDDGSLDRKALGQIVFNDDNKLIKLNSLTHPKIYNNILNEINISKKENYDTIVVDGALLIEAGYLDILDKLLVVTCSIDEQIERIKIRDKCSKEDAINRIKTQMSQEEKAKLADYIIDNSGSLKELKEKADSFIQYIKENWCE